ncbi:MAG TPA: hypothetical protein VKB73_16065 [Gaiellaceae bacterium]|jgi:hypothetical protein|nr:hypothetical protein [Gaiellaceae bacterium]
MATADLDAERDVDLRRYFAALSARWWLPVAGLVGGIIVGFLLSLGGNQVWTANTTVYLGQPLSPTGGVQIQSDATNPSEVGVLIHNEANLRRAAHAAGMPVSKLRGHVSSRPVSGALTKLGQTPFVQITVTGATPRHVQVAANTLAQIVVVDASGYADKLISSWQQQVSTYKQALTTIDQQLKGSSLSATDKLIASINRAQIADQLTTATQQLAVAQEVERAKQKTFAAATKTTAKSRRNTVIVAGLLGLLLGIFAALLWDPVARVVRRST